MTKSAIFDTTNSSILLLLAKEQICKDPHFIIKRKESTKFIWKWVRDYKEKIYIFAISLNTSFQF